MMAAILNSPILNSAILVFPLKLTHTCHIGSHHLHKKNFAHTSPPHHEDGSHPEFCHVGLKKTSLIHSDST